MRAKGVQEKPIPALSFDEYINDIIENQEHTTFLEIHAKNFAFTQDLAHKLTIFVKLG